MDQKKRFIPALVAGALVLVAVFGAFTYKNAFAQSPTPTAPGSATPNSATQPGNVPGQGKGFRGGVGVSETDLATALGIGVDKLQAAYQTANAAALKEAVSKGLITQAQADQYAQEQQNEGHMPFFGLKGTASGIDYEALLAQALGITPEQLKAARTQALDTNLATAVTNGTLTQAQADAIKARNALAADTNFQNSLTSAYQAAVKQAVTEGVITQAQADALLAEQPQGGFFGHGFEGGFGGFGGHGGRGHGGFDRQANPNGSQATPTTPSNSNSGGI